MNICDPEIVNYKIQLVLFTQDYLVALVSQGLNKRLILLPFDSM